MLVEVSNRSRRSTPERQQPQPDAVAAPPQPSSPPPQPSSPPPPQPMWSRQKPLSVVEQQQTSDGVERHLTLLDLVSVGIGGTIGSGIFVLAGYIAHHHAGPATFISFAISGLAAVCSGLSFAELAGRIPASGSTYVYAYVAMGELAAVLAAACLTLEYAAAGAAVARSWGDKVVLWLQQNLGLATTITSVLNPGYGLNPMAFLISAASLWMLLNGVKETKCVSNAMTTLKLLLVLFMIFGGLYFCDSSNLTPFVPFGTAGVLRGATSSFFGYLGYDEVCCIAGESLNPRRDLPRAVLLTLASVAAIYMTAAFALTGMQTYSTVDDTSGFPMAFASNGAQWAMQLTAAGEIMTLPVVVLLSLMAQPRLQYALAKDGLLPQVFARLDDQGNLRSGTWIAGTVMSIVAGCVPFSFLDDLISAGILVSFCMTNTCLVLMRCESPSPKLLPRGMALYNFLCFVTTISLSHGTILWLSLLLCLFLLLLAFYLCKACPKSQRFGNNDTATNHGFIGSEHVEHDSFFEAPCVPLIPLLGIFINWYLISQLEWTGLLLLVAYLGMTTVLYFTCCANNSNSNHSIKPSWKQGQYRSVGLTDDENGDDGIML
ncbi:Amino acid permease [Fragilaria crotonensis]|nr:Amino acid permease [Fragilaria crotonensis]